MAATRLLKVFVEARMIHVANFYLARQVVAHCGGNDDQVLLALVLTAWELRLGSVCLDLAYALELIVSGGADDGPIAEPVELSWPES